MKRSDAKSLEAVILCGGRGSRLKPLTDFIPKAMVPIHGRPVIDHIVQFLENRGVTRFTICIGYLGEKLKQHFSNNNDNKRIIFSDAGEDAGMLQRVWLASQKIDNRFVVVYGDTFVDLDLEKLHDFHVKRLALATIVVAKIRNPFGVVEYDQNGWVTSFTEKPVYNYYIATFIVEKSALEACDKRILTLPDGDGLIGFFNELIKQGKLATYIHNGLELTFNTETEKQRVEQELGKFYTQSEEP